MEDDEFEIDNDFGEYDIKEIYKELKNDKIDDIKEKNKTDEEMNKILKCIGNNIKFYRERTPCKVFEKKYKREIRKNYIPQEELASKLDTSLSTIIRMEKGKSGAITLERLIKLSEIFNINIYSFFKNTSLVASKNLKDINEQLQVLDKDSRECIEKIISYLYINGRTDSEAVKKYMDRPTDAEKIYLIQKILEL